jgi:hypothetical protein
MLNQRNQMNVAESSLARRSRGRVWRGMSSLLDQLAFQQRMLPGFVIIGAMKCGTSSLYDCLAMHPEVAPATKKEIHYFDINFAKGPGWYRTYFPLRVVQRWTRMKGQRLITGEASPYYMFHPNAAKRMHEVIPFASLIVLLRNPTDRAYSHYQHQVRQGREKETFVDAIRLEHERLSHDLAVMEKDESYVGYNHQHFSYLARGVYVDQLMAFQKFFPREQILVLKAEDLFSHPGPTFQKVLSFLHLKSWVPPHFPRINTGGGYTPLSPALREELNEYFAPHNKRLYEYLHFDMAW